MSDERPRFGQRWYHVVEEVHKEHPSLSRTYRAFTDKGAANDVKASLEKTNKIPLHVGEFTPRGRK